MSVDLQKILDSKRAFRRKLAALPVTEKLRMLDAMRERELAIRRNVGTSGLGLREESAPYRSKP
ncbi:MAG TPA: hypothetical protein VH595_20685 [Verrucomicrobiae bacterium]|jgi:hypothetical protein|nr:hypothetical protein [Verrucomicrobiae bacterium]